MITESIVPEGMSPRSTKSSMAGVWHKRAWFQFPLRPRLQTFFLGLPARKPCWAPCCPALTPGPPTPGPLHALFLFFHKYPSNVHSHGDLCWSSYLKLQMPCFYTTLFFFPFPCFVDFPSTYHHPTAILPTSLLLWCQSIQWIVSSLIAGFFFGCLVHCYLPRG